MAVSDLRLAEPVGSEQVVGVPARSVALVMAPRALQAEALAALLNARSRVHAVACDPREASPGDKLDPHPEVGIVWGSGDIAPVLALVRSASVLWAGLPLIVVADHLTAGHVHTFSGCGVAALLDGATCASSLAYAVGQVLGGYHLYTVKLEPTPEHDISVLSRRQLDVLRLLAEGRSNREIAELLYISVNTVKYHVHSILTQLRLRNRTEAARLFVDPTRTDGPTTTPAGVGAAVDAP